MTQINDFLLLVRVFQANRVSQSQVELRHGEAAAAKRLIKRGLLQPDGPGKVWLTRLGTWKAENLAARL